MNIPAYAAMLVLALLAALWLTRPLWRRAELVSQRRRQANVGAYETRLAEIEAEQAVGQLDAEAARVLREEAAARLLQDAASQDQAYAQSPRRYRLAVGLALLLAAASAALYWRGDSWRTRELITLAANDPAAAEQQMVRNLVDELEQRLKAQPEDAEAWAMLGRSYMVLQRAGEAEKAYARANLLSAAQPQPEWLVAQGEAHGIADGRHELGSVRALFEQALKLQPDNAKALFYGGAAALQAGDVQAAYERWLKLRAQPLPEGVAQALDAQLPELAKRAGRSLPAAPATPAAVRLTVKVSLAEALRAQLKPGMTLLVFAKAKDGPAMPLAVKRIESPQLPLSVVLDDSLAMMPSMKLSAFSDWEVTARLTTGAGAQALSGDLEGRHAARRAEAGKPLELLIDQQLP
ncbi:cytochrome c-type biogenesis protein CcmH [Solimonas aquatica]|uniref:Cytochrome c-type biogenesis protein CcmH n=1 Tax=Solimonas aquatica TaxID=489703 RepID=A0A1H9HFB5_9GAMM|nr:c-type cytochrome biogenesis protein CcmI [Solimonas aquatica]SEQ61029.1 cytochrome c-type biogenesis protein CcmH [Solimonas aquatica]